VPHHRCTQLLSQLPVARKLVPAGGQLSAQSRYLGLGISSSRLDSLTRACLSRHGQAD
jgi:hypothetical protein